MGGCCRVVSLMIHYDDAKKREEERLAMRLLFEFTI